MRFCKIPKAFQCPWSAARCVEFVPWLTSSLLVGLYYWTLVVVQFDDSIPSHFDGHHASFQPSPIVISTEGRNLSIFLIERDALRQPTALFPIKLLDHAALFNLFKKTCVDEIRRPEIFCLWIGLAIEYRLQRFFIRRWGSFEQIGLFIVEISSFLGAQAAEIFLQQSNRTSAIGFNKMHRLDKRMRKPLDHVTFALDKTPSGGEGARRRKNLQFDSAAQQSTA